VVSDEGMDPGILFPGGRTLKPADTGVPVRYVGTGETLRATIGPAVQTRGGMPRAGTPKKGLAAMYVVLALARKRQKELRS